MVGALWAMRFVILLRRMENRTTGLRPLEMHPYRWLAPPLPPEGEVPPQAGIGVHFHRPKGGRFVFPLPPGRLFGFIQTGAPSFSKGATPPAAAGGHNPGHRGPSGPMDAICPSAAKGRRPLREYSRPADWYLLPLATLTTRTEILRWRSG